MLFSNRNYTNILPERLSSSARLLCVISFNTSDAAYQAVGRAYTHQNIIWDEMMTNNRLPDTADTPSNSVPTMFTLTQPIKPNFPILDDGRMDESQHTRVL